jgi:hypothetical protein
VIPAFKICTTKNAFLYVEQKDRAYLDKWIPWRIKGAYVEVKDKNIMVLERCCSWPSRA